MATSPTSPADSSPVVSKAVELVAALCAHGVKPDNAARTAAMLLCRTPGRLLTAEEFAAWANRDVETVLKWSQKGVVPSVRTGGKGRRNTLVGFHLETVLKALTVPGR